MTKAQREIRRRKVRQRIINRSTRRLIIANAIVILLIMIATLYLVTSSMEKVQVTNTNEAKESKVENAESIEVEEYPFELSEYPTFSLHTQKIGMLKIVICLQRLQWQKQKDAVLNVKNESFLWC